MTTTGAMPTLDRDECIRKLAEAGIKGRDATTSLTQIENRLSPVFFMPRLRAELERHMTGQEVDDVYISLFGSDAGRAAIVLAH